MKGYKLFKLVDGKIISNNMSEKNSILEYKLNVLYECKLPIKYAQNGFHFYKSVSHCIWNGTDKEDFIICEVESIGDNSPERDSRGHGLATNKLIIHKILTTAEIFDNLVLDIPSGIVITMLKKHPEYVEKVLNKLNDENDITAYYENYPEYLELFVNKINDSDDISYFINKVKVEGQLKNILREKAIAFDKIALWCKKYPEDTFKLHDCLKESSDILDFLKVRKDYAIEFKNYHLLDSLDSYILALIYPQLRFKFINNVNNVYDICNWLFHYPTDINYFKNYDYKELLQSRNKVFNITMENIL